MVVRHGQARLGQLQVAKQQDIQVQGAWAPALGLARAALLQFDALQGIEQLQWRQCSVQRRHGVDIARLVGRTQRVADIEGGLGRKDGLRQRCQRRQCAAQLFEGGGQVAAQADIGAQHPVLGVALHLIRRPGRRCLRPGRACACHCYAGACAERLGHRPCH